MTHASSWILLAALAVAAVIGKLLEPFLNKQNAQKMALSVAKRDSFQTKGPLLSPAEFAFYKVLVQSVGSSVAVAPKVRLADIITPAAGQSRSGWQRDFNKLAMKHVDFVLFDQNDGSVIGVIELDDSSHSTLEAGIKDMFKNAALGSAGIPITRFNARRSYDISEVREKIPRNGYAQFGH
jgi:hypothetical protein